MDNKMRKRGWSITSDNAESQPHSHSKKHNHRANSNGSGSGSGRPRSNTDHSEDTLTAADKLELLNSVPSSELESQEEEEEEEGYLQEKTEDHKDDGENDEEDVIDMFGETSDGNDNDDPPPKKRRRVDDENDEDEKKEENGTGTGNGNGNGEGTSNGNGTSSSTTDNNDNNDDDVKTQKQQELLQNAKKRLSKWAARLFDPDRPRGLVEAPQIIPLNDEFLTQFGKREKEFDVKTGRVMELDTDNLDDDVEEGYDDGITNTNGEKGDTMNVDAKKDTKKSSKEMKVKIANLAYATTELNLARLCERYGPVTEVKLLMDENNPNRSKGRAYVTFELVDDGTTFLESMNEKSFEGRILRINAAVERKGNGNSGGGGRGGSGGGRGLARYWEKDISTKCYRCGQVGHMVSNCPNEELPKPCPLCAKTGHDSYSCPLSRICFNCGVPGHINRECPERRGMPRRIVCGACFISGHHRWECRERLHNIPSYNAQCLVCGDNGHFTCEDMKWFFGLKGLTCFNCGQAGHHGSECDRPKVDECIRNNDLLQRELERAEAVSLAEELEEQRRKRSKKQHDHSRGRDRGRDNHRHDSGSRAKSQPPPRSFQPEQQSSSYGRIRGGSKRNHHRDDESRSPTSSRGRQNGNNRRGYNDQERHRSRSSSSRGKRGYH